LAGVTVLAGSMLADSALAAGGATLARPGSGLTLVTLAKPAVESARAATEAAASGFPELPNNVGPPFGHRTEEEVSSLQTHRHPYREGSSRERGNRPGRPGPITTRIANETR
jgi:hypothetical protein